MFQLKLKMVVKALLPPVAVRLYQKFKKDEIRFIGNFATLQQARGNSTGYDADLILEKVSNSLLKVKSGVAVYERDSVLFDKIEHPFPLLTGLFMAATENGGDLTVLDFGGSLGSSYFQCRGVLAILPKLTWCIVEQEKFVQRGRELFESDQLRFFYTLEECCQQRAPNVVLFASVLQYLDDPHSIVESAIGSGAQYIIIDRTPFSDLSEDRLCVQHVPAEIYKASYPCRILSSSKLERLLDSQFELLADFDALGGCGHVSDGFDTLPFQYKGMIWRRR